MRNRGVKKQFWFSRDEDYLLKLKSSKAGLTESDYIRNLVVGYEPREKPDDRFYNELKFLRGLSNNLNQVAKKANALGFIDELEYKKNVDMVNQFIIDFKKEFFLPKDSNCK